MNKYFKKFIGIEKLGDKLYEFNLAGETGEVEYVKRRHYLGAPDGYGYEYRWDFKWDKNPKGDRAKKEERILHFILESSI